MFVEAGEISERKLYLVVQGLVQIARIKWASITGINASFEIPGLDKAKRNENE